MRGTRVRFLTFGDFVVVVDVMNEDFEVLIGAAVESGKTSDFQVLDIRDIVEAIVGQIRHVCEI